MAANRALSFHFYVITWLRTVWCSFVCRLFQISVLRVYICNMCVCVYIYLYSFLVHVSAFAMECANASVFCLICTLWFMCISNDKRVTWLNYTNIHDTIIRCHKVFARYSVMLIIFARKTYVLLLLLFFFLFFSFCCCCFFSCFNQCTPWFNKNKLSLVFQTRGP